MKLISVFHNGLIQVYKMNHPFFKYRIMKLQRDSIGWAIFSTFHTAQEAEEYLREVLV